MRILIAVFAGLSALCASAHAATIEGRVVGVTDGDTVKVLVREHDQVVVRLFAIDAPETTCHAWSSEKADDRCIESGQPFGKAAKKQLSSLVFGKTVRVQTTGEVSHGRTMGTLWVGSLDANLEMVKAGYACHYVAFARSRQAPSDFRSYASAETLARQRKLGQWSDARSRCGWDYRKTSSGKAL